MIEIFSTSQAHRETGVEFWNNLLGQTYQGLVVDPLDRRFRAELKRWSLDRMTLTWPQSTRARVSRMRVAQSSDNLVLHILHTGRCAVSLRGRTAHLAPGDMMLCAAQEAYEFDAPDDHQLLIVEFDRNLLAHQITDVDSHIARLVSGELASTRILRNFLLSLWREGANTLDGESSALYNDTILSLTAAALQANPSPAATGDDLPLARVKGIIEARLHDAALTPSSIAEQIGMPLRTLQLACAKRGITLSAYIIRRRLEKACELLVNSAGRSVTAIAFDVGFNDCAYFARRFHAAFGVSPSEYRTRH
ncbi:helix-turn-helix domain-containing protein [Blastomonas sp. AAP53]|uniref:helix-turn-helix domain-containing protein n=1 Tax=Blastomonas sp. AAP53 TaxID=1248760 RepID=UPI0002FB2E99|nr:helix-turn-helix domain-containing protein [Blastomonas sp. AAP53]